MIANKGTILICDHQLKDFKLTEEMSQVLQNINSDQKLSTEQLEENLLAKTDLVRISH